MAAQFLASHGLNLNSILSHGNVSAKDPTSAPNTISMSKIINAKLPHKLEDSLWDLSIGNGCIIDISPHSSAALNITHLPSVLDAQGGLTLPSLCHAHIHLDKCFLLHDPAYSDLPITEGSFAEAMSLTNTAKSRFDVSDLQRRGRRLIRESVTAGVTGMRAFVEVDEVVGLKCVEAGLLLKKEWIDACDVQLCAFAQLALFSGDDGGTHRRKLLEQALDLSGVDVIGSTPYVEEDETRMKQNVEWTIAQALRRQIHLDFHLDYNIDPDTPALVWFVLAELRRQEWHERAAPHMRICLGHSTRLTLFSAAEWQRLRKEIGDLPIAFVGLPTSDLFMMGRPQEDDGGGQRPRATLQVPHMVRKHELCGAISINNVGNAFTPQGTCDPLALASLAVGVYQAGTEQDTELIYELISRRAFEAVGLTPASLTTKQDDSATTLGLSSAKSTTNPADLIVFSPATTSPHRRPRSISEAVYAGGSHFIRRTIYRGRLVDLGE